MAPGLARWLAAYLRGRQTAVTFRGAKSKHRQLRCGVPQGAVLSPLLFNAYTSTIPTPRNSAKIVAYADDITVYAQHQNYDVAADEISAYLPALSDFLDNRKLSPSPAKSTVTLLTPSTAEASHHPQVLLKGDLLPLARSVKLLGVTFDTMMTFGEHARVTATKAAKGTSILRALAGTTWGANKETLLTTFKAISRSQLDYGAPVWSPSLCETHRTRLDRTQNAAIRAITGCHQMSAVDHLHAEVMCLTAREHAELLTRQFWLRTHMPDHPNHYMHNIAPGPRQIRDTLRSKHDEDTLSVIANEDLLDQDGALDETGYRRGLQALHTRAVQSAKEGYHPRSCLVASLHPASAPMRSDCPAPRAAPWPNCAAGSASSSTATGVASIQ